VTLVIAGPTGVGKSELALRIAEAAGGEIVNFDSIQLYRGFDIGSAKPSPEIRARIPHHLFDVLEATDEFNAADFARLARPLLEQIRFPILVGGTFFYLRAVLAGLPEMPGRNEALRMRLRKIRQARLYRWLTKVDPQSARSIAPGDRHRVERALEVWIASGKPISRWERPTEEARSIKIALSMERRELVKVLDWRVNQMYTAGLIEETRSLLERYPESARPFSAIGYREAVAVIDGTMTIDAAMSGTRRRTRAYSKRQMTWLRSERNVHWVGAAESGKAFEAALRLIEGES
jgi:tRNA dimethylallyltransferase